MGYQSSLCQAMPGIKFFVYIFIISLLSPVPAFFFLTVGSNDLWGDVALLASGQEELPPGAKGSWSLFPSPLHI